MASQKYVCVDLDGTIASYRAGWQGEKHFGDPIPGVQSALWRIKSAGWKIIIYTTRANKKLVGAYLKSHSIPFDYINLNPEQPKNAMGGKPYADAYIDDRGIQFNGDWQKTAEEVLKFVPWEDRGPVKPGEDYRKAAIGYLAQDYDRVFEQLRAYDAQITDLTKTSFVQLVGSIGAVWAIYSFAFQTGTDPALKSLWRLPGAAILIISSVFSLLIIQLIMRNRQYFAATARYINDFREFYLHSKPLGFKNRSEYWTDWHEPYAFNRESTQYLFVVVLVVAGALLFGMGVGLLASYIGATILWSVIVALIVGVIAIFRTMRYVDDYLNPKKEKGKEAEGTSPATSMADLGEAKA